MVNDILENLYPPQREDVASSLRLLRTLRALFVGAPSCLLVPLLKAVQGGFCIWIEDKEEAVSEPEYNDVVRVCICRDKNICSGRLADDVSLRRLTHRTPQAASFSPIA